MSFTRLTPEDIVISAESITSALFSNSTPTLTTFFTSSAQKASSAGSYYIDVYNLNTTNTSSEVQFSVAYGNLDGSGSVVYNPLISGSSPTRTTYGQYRNLVIGDENVNFNFGSGTCKDIFVISVERSRFKEKLMPGTFNLNIKSGSTTLRLTDDSLNATTISYKDSGRVYNIVSGSNGKAILNAQFPGVQAGYNPSGSYGWFLPDVGLIVLNGEALKLAPASGGLSQVIPNSYNTNDENHIEFFKIISGAGSFTLNSEETITSDFVFVRVKNSEFNYSTNPSFISGSTGEVIFSNFVNNPQTYVTTIGLYNDNNDLLAVAKLSKPLPKDFTKEALLRVKLDF